MSRVPAPSLVVTIELEGPLWIYPHCKSKEEEVRLATDLLSRDISLDEQVRLWGEGVLARAIPNRWMAT